VKVSFRRFAHYEFDEAADWYDGERIGLGAEFIAEIEALVARISADPYLYQKALGSIRRAVAPRFPYSIYYKVRKSEIVVLAVFAGARDPAIWQNRS
jgi:toxin ParE1/3/4